MTILKALIAGGQVCLRRSYATGSKYIETTRDNDTGKNAIISIECYFILCMPLSNFILIVQELRLYLWRENLLTV